MSADSRRSPRLIDFLPLEVWVIRAVDNMTQVLQQHVHVFHTTRTTDGLVLQLRINLQPECTGCQLTARPVWLSTVQQRTILAFKMGIEFTVDPNKEQMQELRQALHADQEQRADWWQRHSHLLQQPPQT